MSSEEADSTGSQSREWAARRCGVVHLLIQSNLVASKNELVVVAIRNRMHSRIFQRGKFQKRHVWRKRRQSRGRRQRHLLALDPIRGDVNRRRCQTVNSPSRPGRTDWRAPQHSPSGRLSNWPASESKSAHSKQTKSYPTSPNASVFCAGSVRYVNLRLYRKKHLKFDR